MKKIIYILIPFLLLSCYNVECNCKDFKTGKFRSEIVIKGIKKEVTFTRTESLQIETYNGKTDSSTVRWVNDCEFITRKIHPKTMEEEKSFSVKILTTNKNTYKVEYSEVGKSIKMTSIVTKIE